MNVIDFFAENNDLFLLAIAALSLLIGSFLNVAIHRLPQMLMNRWNQECREYLGLKPTPQAEIEPFNLWLPFSHCTHCKKHLKPWHNIPILSYFVLRGKCAYCQNKISLRYPLVELLCCIVSVYVAWEFGFTFQTLGALLFTWIMLCLAFIDIDYQLLPDQLTFLLLWIGLFLSLFGIFTPTHDAILGAIIGYLIFASIQGLFHLITGKVGIGQGDYKLLAALGGYLGWQQLPFIILFASLIGIVFSLIHMIIKQELKSTPLAFGPSLAIAGWTSLMWGNEILYLYKSVI